MLTLISRSTSSASVGVELLSHPRRTPSAFLSSDSLDGDYNLLLHTKSKDVSRKHAEIVYKDGQWWVRNISRFGTSVFRDGVEKRLTGGVEFRLRGKTKQRHLAQVEAEESDDQEGARSDEGTSRQRATSTPDIYTNGRLAKGPMGSGVDTERSTVQSGEREGEGVAGGEGEGEGGDKGEDEGKGEGEDKGEDKGEDEGGDKGGAEGWAEDGDPDANQTLDEDQDSAPLVGFGIMIMGSSLVGFMPYELCQQVRWHRPYTLPG